MKTLNRSIKGLFLLLTLTLSTVPFASGCTGQTDPDEDSDSIDGEGDSEDSEDGVSLEPQLKGALQPVCLGGYVYSVEARKCVIDTVGTGG